MKKRILLTLIISVNTSLIAQENDNRKYEILTIQENETYIFDGDSLFLDKLILKDNSKVQFLKDVYVVVMHGYFGNNVIFDLSGKNGADGKNGTEINVNGENGSYGEFGKNIELIIQFEELGSFTINTSGGNGGNGGNGFSPKRNNARGDRGFNGGDAGIGGIGLNAGNIDFNYSSPNFIPLFNGIDKHAIQFIKEAGICGKSGKPGKGGGGGGFENVIDQKTGKVLYKIEAGSKGMDGLSRGGCFNGKEGSIIINKLL